MFENHEKVVGAVKDGFRKESVLVVGDLILDAYCWGEVHRISPEAPVPVVHMKRESWSGGGAANVAINLVGLGLSVSIAGLVGEDSEKDRLLQILHNNNIDTTAVIAVRQWRTILKTRVIAGNQLMLRLDKEEPVNCSDREFSRLAKAVQAAIENRPSAIILSDYAKGVLSENLCRRIISRAGELDIPVLVDPKDRIFTKYSGATMVSPNRAEMAKVANVAMADLDGLMKAGQELSRSLNIKYFLITLSEQGIVLLREKSRHHFPAKAKEVYDVSGAGDTVIAVMAAGLVSGLSLNDTVQLANIAAGIVVSKIGIYPVTAGDLLMAISREQGLEQSEKICQFEDLLVLVDQWRKHGGRIVFTNGCFDLLHAGHVVYLEHARNLGDHLIVGLNTDRSVRVLKGPTRPLISQHDRARVLAALAAVDAVVLFDEDTPMALISRIRPDILAKGADYAEDQVVGGDFVKAHGGKVVLVPLIEGRSSSSIIDAARKNSASADRGITSCTS